MRMFLKSATVAVALAGAAFAASGSASADDYGRWHHRDRAESGISINLGNVAFGYRDGYWDNGHQWHRWDHDGDYRTYRDRQGSNYRDWNHDRDGDGWQPSSGVSIGFGNVAFGYRDGYWDTGHRWHRWSNDGDYRNYRYRHGSNYHDWNHDRDGDGWQPSDGVISIGFGNIAYGYRDGYWDNDRQWHRWSHDGDYRQYRDHHGSNYRDWDHDRERNHGWRRD